MGVIVKYNGHPLHFLLHCIIAKYLFYTTYLRFIRVTCTLSLLTCIILRFTKKYAITPQLCKHRNLCRLLICFYSSN